MLQLLRNNAQKIIIFTLTAFVLSTIIIALTSSMGSKGKRGTQQKVQGVLATINNEEINQNQFIRLYNASVQNYKQPGQKDPIDPKLDEYLRYSALTRAIESEKYLKFAKKNKIKVSRKELNGQINGMITNYKLKSKKEFKELLTRNGYNYKEFEKDVRNELAVNKLTQATKQRIMITDRDIQNQYKKVNARHILIQPPYTLDTEEADKLKKQARDKAAQLYDRIVSGEDFAELAKEFSTDKGSAVNGGSLGVFGVGMMVPEFEDVAFALAEGQVSKPFETQFGFHIVKVDAIQQEEVPLDVDEKELKEKLLQEKQEQSLQKLAQTIAQEYKHEIFLDSVKAYEYRLQGDFDKALTAYRMLSSQNPRSPIPYIFIAEIYELKKDFKQAKKEYDKALLIEKINPETKTPFVKFSMAASWLSLRPALSPSLFLS